MRTRDFSRAPRPARAEALAVVEAGQGVGVRHLRSAAAGSAGHVWTAGFRTRGARGVLGFFATPDQAAGYVAALPAGVRSTIFTAEAEGYSNGVWRAEGDVMAHVERFTPLAREVDGGITPPRVAGQVRSHRGRLGGPATAAPGSPVDAGAMFVGATRYRGPHSWAVLARDWYPMVAAMRRMRGYVWHRTYWQAPFTLGTLAFFRTRDDLLVFARLPAHRHLMQWITRDRRHGTGGFIRLLGADVAPDGHRGER